MDLSKNMNFSTFRTFIVDQLNLLNRNRFDPLTKGKNDGVSSNRTNQTNSLGGLKFISLNINTCNIRGKKLDLLAFLDVHTPHIVAIQEIKIDSSIATSELFPETCPYKIFRKDRNLHGGGVMLLIHKDIPHMALSELENDSETVWVKAFANKTSHYVASWYRPPGGSSEDFILFGDQLDQIRNKHKGNKLPSVHVLGDFNFKDIAWPGRLNKSGSMLSQSEGQMLIAIMNDHGLEQLLHFPPREKNTLDLILISPDKLSDHDFVSGTPPPPPQKKKPRRKVYLYHKGDFESMRKDASDFAKDRYFNGYSDNRSVQANFDLITSFIQESADKHIPSKTSRSVSSVPWITPEIRRKIRRRNKTKKTGSSKIKGRCQKAARFECQ